jgi:large subunit ribosomal protein L1
MIRHSKRFKILKDKIKKKKYSLNEAICLIKEMGTVKFLESVEAHISLNIDPRYVTQQFRTTILLPYGTGKFVKVAVYTEDNNICELLKHEVHLIGSNEIIENIKAEKFNFDILITTPEYMPKLAQFGKILGPKGLMPSPKAGSVSPNLLTNVSEFKRGKMECRCDKSGVVHLCFGKTNFTIEELKENLIFIYNSIEKTRPIGLKGQFFKSLNICTSMSPSISIEISSIIKLSKKNILYEQYS